MPMKLAPPDQHGVKAGRWDVERLEERGHLLDAVDLAPPGREEHEPDGEPTEEQSDAAEPLEPRQRLGPQRERAVDDSCRHGYAGSP